MMPIELPAGRYLSLAFRVTADSGGQTRALLMRNRILATEGGVRPDVLTLGPAPDYPRRRELLREQGQLVDGIGLLNIYEHFRDHGWGDREPTGATLEDLSAHVASEEPGPDGTPWRVIHKLPGEQRPVIDYLRPDGTPYLRMPAFSINYKAWWGGRIQLVGEGGAIVGEFKSPGQWFRRWIRELADDGERTFVFMDSRFVVPHVASMRRRRLHLIYLMHNMHVDPPRRWDSEIGMVYRRALSRIGELDAMVTLTERQRDDVAERYGRTSNLFVVPNPVSMPAPPAGEAPRDPHRVTIAARLEPQKGLGDAIAAFRRVVDAVPAARLDIYGDGSQAPALAAQIERSGLAGSVTLHGFDPRAREALWTSSAFLMTSAFEGYPLSTLESMSRGCPVVSYDIKYGPREQITDGVDGFLVPAGDTSALAQRVIELLRSPELVQRMSAAARERAGRYGPAEFLASWAGVLRATIDHRPLRTEIEDVQLELTRLRHVSGNPLGRLLGRGPDFALGPVAPGRALELAGTLRVKGESRKAGLDSIELGLAWIDGESGDVAGQPLRVKLAEEEFQLRATVPLPARDARLRLRLTWRNSAWETVVATLEGGELSRPVED